jgi:hypothetical protein
MHFSNFHSEQAMFSAVVQQTLSTAASCFLARKWEVRCHSGLRE